MSPIAAYYVMIATDHERQARKPRYESAVPKASLVERLTSALGTLVHLGRPTTVQPI